MYFITCAVVVTSYGSLLRSAWFALFDVLSCGLCPRSLFCKVCGACEFSSLLRCDGYLLSPCSADRLSLYHMVDVIPLSS